MKIGNYTDDEILEFMTEGEGRGFLGRSMFDAMYFEIERLNNIINTILDFNFFKEECPLNFGYTEKSDEEKAQDVFYEDDYCENNCNDEYKKCWLKYFERLQELKGSESNECKRDV